MKDTTVDKFGNHWSNKFPCPRCGTEWLMYVGQYDSFMCVDADCDWSEAIFGQENTEKIDYSNPNPNEIPPVRHEDSGLELKRQMWNAMGFDV